MVLNILSGQNLSWTSFVQKILKLQKIELTTICSSSLSPFMEEYKGFCIKRVLHIGNSPNTKIKNKRKCVPFAVFTQILCISCSKYWANNKNIVLVLAMFVTL